jgi:hypothetical protein
LTRPDGAFAYPGRLTVRVLVPDDLLAEAQRLAAERGLDLAIVLGDLAAEALPDALAEAARHRLASRPPAETAPESSPAPSITSSTTPSPKFAAATSMPGLATSSEPTRARAPR